MAREQNDRFEIEDGDAVAEGGGSPMVHLLAVVIGAAVLYAAKEILMPLALAAILALILSPAVARLERWVGRIASSAMVVVLAITFVGGTAYFFTLEVTAVATDISTYSDNIIKKINALKESAPPAIRQIEESLANIRSKIEGPAPAKPKVPVVELIQPETLTEWLSPTLPVLVALFEAFIVVVLMFFLLYDRKSLRDQFVRLAARARITIPSQAIEAASRTISNYLLIYSIINLVFGILIGLACWALGLPRPELWGALSFLLRYVPYVGAIASAALPTIVAFAVFPGWVKAFEILAIYVVLDQIIGQFLQPILIGKGVGVSPVALLVSAIFWAWLWGPMGLLLSTPFAVCLKVGGDYIPALGFFSILFGAAESLEGPHDYYRRLLELDRHGAHAQAVRYCDERGIEKTFEDIFAPALKLAEEERLRNNIGDARLEIIHDHTRELIIHLADRTARRPLMPRPRVLGVCVPDDSHPLDLLMLLELLRVDGFTTRFNPGRGSAAEIKNLVGVYEPDLICLSSPTAGYVSAAVELVRGLGSEFPGVAIIGAGPCDDSTRNLLLEAGCRAVAKSLHDARRAIRDFADYRAPSGYPESVAR